MGLAGAEGEDTGSVLTTRTRIMVPPEARAKRAAIGSARSARSEPSRGTRIRLNMHILLTDISMTDLSIERSCGYVYKVEVTDHDRLTQSVMVCGTLRCHCHLLLLH